MQFLRLVAVFLCVMIVVLADDSKSIDGGIHFDYGKERSPEVKNTKPSRDTAYSHYYPRKYKRRKIEYVDGLPLYRD